MTKITHNEQRWLEEALALGGLEVHKSDWPIAERLVKLGLAVMGPARGPDEAFKRFWNIEDEELI